MSFNGFCLAGFDDAPSVDSFLVQACIKQAAIKVTMIFLFMMIPKTCTSIGCAGMDVQILI